MNEALTPNDQALILLTQRLDASGLEPIPITLQRLGEIEATLRASGQEIGYLLTHQGRQLAHEMEDGSHVQSLLDRAFRLGLKAQQWTQQNIEVVSRASALYPQRLPERMGVQSPAVLYCMGDTALLNAIQTTILLPEQSQGDLAKYAERLGQAAQKLGSTAAGAADTRADQAFINAAISNDSNAVGVVTTGLMRALADKRHQQDVAANRLLLVSTKPPEEENQTADDIAQARLMIHALAGRTMLVRPGSPPSWQWADLIMQPSRATATRQHHDEDAAVRAAAPTTAPITAA